MPVEIKYAPPIEPDTYEATLTDLQQKTSQKTGGDYRWWQFTLADGRTISSVTGLSFGPRARAGQWAAALLGRTPELGEMVELIGLPCLIGVTIDDEGFSQVSSLLGRPKSVRKVTPAQLAEQQHAAQEGVNHEPGGRQVMPVTDSSTSNTADLDPTSDSLPF